MRKCPSRSKVCPSSHFKYLKVPLYITWGYISKGQWFPTSLSGLSLCPSCIFSTGISPSDCFSLDSAWIFPLPSTNYTSSKSHDVSSPAVNNFLLNPRAYSLEKAHSLLEFKIHMPDHIFSPWDFIASDQDSAEDRKGGKQCVFVFSFGFWFNLVKFLEKQLVTPFFLMLFHSEV